jgi:hypothetical protein
MRVRGSQILRVRKIWLLPILFDHELQLASLFAPEIKAQLRRHGHWFVGDGGTLYDLYRLIST